MNDDFASRIKTASLLADAEANRMHEKSPYLTEIDRAIILKNFPLIGIRNSRENIAFVRAVKEYRWRMNPTVAMEMAGLVDARTKLIGELYDFTGEFQWISLETFRSATQFIWDLPLDTPRPDFEVERPIDCVTLSWNSGPDRALLVQIYPFYKLNISARIEGDAFSMTKPFHASLPKAVGEFAGAVFRLR